jgi:hypothetical protein
VASLLLALGACTGFEQLTVGADPRDADAVASDVGPEHDAGDHASAPEAGSPPASAPDAAESTPFEPPLDAAASAGPADGGVAADVEPYDGHKTCCERWEEFLGAPPLQPCAELRCTSVLPPPPPRFPPLLDSSLLPALFDAGFR